MEQVREPVKEEKGQHVWGIACRVMAGVSPVAANSPTQLPFPTPSPFTPSVISTRQSSKPYIYKYSNLLLRFLVLLFSFISALSLAVPSNRKKEKGSPSFTYYPELMYCFIVSILAFVYAFLQLFKGIFDIAHRGILISDMALDYLSFILDQLVGYLVVSSSSVAIPIIRQTKPVWNGIIVSTVMSFATFVAIAICALLSGYKLCKRIVW